MSKKQPMGSHPIRMPDDWWETVQKFAEKQGSPSASAWIVGLIGAAFGANVVRKLSELNPQGKPSTKGK